MESQNIHKGLGRLSSTKLILLGFCAIILIGTALLSLPAASRNGRAGLTDAFFTATSATCVTGLVRFDTYTHWSLFGQVVILCLIQIGGIGFMTIALSLLSLTKRKIGLAPRVLMQESIGAPQVGGMIRMTKFILGGTALVEGLGALLLSFYFCPRFGLAKGLYFSVFHSVSALFVQTPAFSHMSKENKLRLQANVKLARQLGARIETVYGDDVPFQIAEFARLTGASKVVVGRSNTQRRLLMLGRQRFIDRLTVLAPNLDIYVIPEIKRQPFREARYRAKPVFTLQDTLKSCLLLLGATLLGWIFERLGFSEANIITVYILGVLVTAIVTSNRSYSIFSALLSVIVFNFLFTDPRYSLTAYDSGYPVTFLVMFLAAFLTGSLAARIKSQAKQSARTAYRTQLLLETNQLLQQEKTPEGIAEATARQLMKLLGKSVVFYGVKDDALTEPRIFSAGKEDERLERLMTDNEKAVAQWAFRNNKHAGATTNTLGSAQGLYLAVRGSDGVYGVMGIALQGGSLDAFENNLVLSMLSECALALERDLFSRKREEAAMQAKNEQLRANLLRSISHDLRTPLTSISGNAGVLLNNAGTLDDTKLHKLYMDIYDDSMWLINLVENLLSVTRIEDGTMHLTMEAELLEEVITEALRHINRKSTEHTIRVVPPQGFVMARMDARLIVQVIINIVDNAIKYTPVGSEIVIRAVTKGKTVEVSIADDGPGIPDEAKARIFDMFYTAKATKAGADSRRGLGLGLALCRSIITAHGGTIAVEDNHPHGTIFRFTLQAEEVSIHE